MSGLTQDGTTYAIVVLKKSVSPGSVSTMVETLISVPMVVVMTVATLVLPIVVPTVTVEI